MNSNRRKRWGVILLVIGFGLTAWGVSQILAPAQYCATVRVKLGGTDKDSVQRELEVMRSEPVLSAAWAASGLSPEWSRRYADGQPLAAAEGHRLLREHLGLRQIQGTSVIEVRATSTYQDEPHQIANAIATAYRNVRTGQREESVSKSLKPIEEKLAGEIQQMIALEEKRYQLHVEIETNDASFVTAKLTAYNELTQRIHELKLSQMELQEKLAEERVKQRIPGISTVGILELASPPQRPLSFGRDLGIGLVCAGVLSGVGGAWLLKKPRPQKPATSPGFRAR